jgi:hypothetical protein
MFLPVPYYLGFTSPSALARRPTGKLSRAVCAIVFFSKYQTAIDAVWRARAWEMVGGQRKAAAQHTLLYYITRKHNRALPRDKFIL